MNRIPQVLLNLDGSSSLLELSLDFVSLSLRDALLDGLRSSLNELLSLLESETEKLLDSLDNAHLSVTEGSENDIKLGLLSSGGSSAGGGSGSYNGGNSELLLDSVNKLLELENREALNLFNNA